MPARKSVYLLALAVLAACLLGGCAETFTARKVDPLRAARSGPARADAWQPGTLSPSVLRTLVAQGFTSPQKDVRPLLRRLETAGKTRAALELALWAGVRAQRKLTPDAARPAGFYLCAAELSSDALIRGENPRADAAAFREANRFAVARLVDIYEDRLTDGDGVIAEIDGPTRRYRLTARQTAGADVVAPARYDVLKPTDRYRLIGVREHVVIDGPGAPLVARVRAASDNKTRRAFQMADNSVVPLTAVVNFAPPAGETRPAILELHDPRWQETGTRRPLAADYTTPLAAAAAGVGSQRFLNLGILGFLRSDEYFDKIGLYPVESEQPGKVPVVLVHGLVSEPNDWRHLRNALLADPEIRRNCQFWVFFYPTSLPVAYSAARLREGLVTARRQLDPGRRDPAMSDMVMVGHSMGGLLTRLQISESGDTMYRQWFRRPLQQLLLDATERDLLQNVAYFHPNPDIDEAIFLCVPHRGSPLAASFIGKIARRIAGLPQRLVGLSVHLLTVNREALVTDVTGPGSSIDSLTPGRSLFRALEKMPMPPATRLHSIIGDRGRGDTPNSSDGVVPYWSSQLPQTQSEKIIPANHSALGHPEALAEIQRIVREHVQQRSGGASRKRKREPRKTLPSSGRLSTVRR